MPGMAPLSWRGRGWPSWAILPTFMLVGAVGYLRSPFTVDAFVLARVTLGLGAMLLAGHLLAQHTTTTAMRIGCAFALLFGCLFVGMSACTDSVATPARIQRRPSTAPSIVTSPSATPAPAPKPNPKAVAEEETAPAPKPNPKAVAEEETAPTPNTNAKAVTQEETRREASVERGPSAATESEEGMCRQIRALEQRSTFLGKGAVSSVHLVQWNLRKVVARRSRTAGPDDETAAAAPQTGLTRWQSDVRHANMVAFSGAVPHAFVPRLFGSCLRERRLLNEYVPHPLGKRSSKLDASVKALPRVKQLHIARQLLTVFAHRVPRHAVH